MNINRIIFWICFVAILLLIVWGMIVALGRPVPGQSLATPAPVTSADHVRGLDTAPVTIIEYSDFQCPACENYYPTIEKVLNNSSTTTRFVYRHFPLSQHKNALPAAYASEAASKQGKFWDMYEKIFTNHADWTELADATPIFEKYATEIGLDVDKFKLDSNSTTTKALVVDQQTEGQKIGVNSTPSFFVNGVFIKTPPTYEEFIKIIGDAALSASSN